MALTPTSHAPPSQPRRGGSSGTPRSSQSATPNPSQLEPPKAPDATTALGALEQIIDCFNDFPKNFAQKHKDKITAKVELARRLFVAELDSCQHAPPPGDGSGPARLLPASTATLEAALRSTQQAVTSLQKDLAQVVKASVKEALEASAPVLSKSIAPTPATPAPVQWPPRDSPRHLDVTIGLPRSARGDSALVTLSATQLKSEVDAALDASSIPGLVGSRVRGVRRLPNGSLLIRAASQDQADLLFHHDGQWLAHLQSFKGARIERKSYSLIASSVPMDFDPAAPCAAESLWLENAGTVASKAAIRDLRWLHTGRSKSSKREGSLVFSVSDAAAADHLIYSSFSMRGALCPVRKFTPPPMQCYRCQAFGHSAKACPHISSSSSLHCARCAGAHVLRDCTCPAKTKCADGRHCAHITVQCANCRGNHKSFDSKCPVKAQEQRNLAARFDNGSCYFNPAFHPPAQPRAHGAVAA